MALEISFRLSPTDDGQVYIESRLGPADQQGLTSGWSHMHTAPDEVSAAGACDTEILYQLSLLVDEDA